jgi:glutathione synthase/RimK-type ligase-like ATP-grasp enzyme
VILLCGIPSEAPMRLVSEAAARLGVQAVVFNQRLAREIELAFTASPGEKAAYTVSGILRLQGQPYDLSSFTGVYVRLMDYMDIPDLNTPSNVERSTLNLQPPTLQPSNLQPSTFNLQRSLIDWLEVADVKVMNRLGAMGSNQSKPYQAQLIAQAGFLIPPTLVTNDPDEARAFVETHRRVVYKSISAVRSVVHELDRPRLRDLEKIRYLPTQFQAFIPGENLRVHVAGEQVFGAQIETPAVDYRYASQDGLDVEIKAVYIEEELAGRCLALSRALGLPLCGIDLKRTPQGEVYCFEANPSPAFSFYQEQTGQDVAAAVVEYLGSG